MICEINQKAGYARWLMAITLPFSNPNNEKKRSQVQP